MNRFTYAWRMALASYGYTRACDGYVINEMGGKIRFGRWYAFWGAVRTWWDCLRNPRPAFKDYPSDSPIMDSLKKKARKL